MSIQQNVSIDAISIIRDEVRFISGVNNAIKMLKSCIDPAKLEAKIETITSQNNKNILSAALRYRRAVAGTTDAYFSKETAKMIIELFNHAARIPTHDIVNMDNTCKGIGNLITSFPMFSKQKKIARVKGGTEESDNTETAKE